MSTATPTPERMRPGREAIETSEKAPNEASNDAKGGSEVGSEGRGHQAEEENEVCPACSDSRESASQMVARMLSDPADPVPDQEHRSLDERSEPLADQELQAHELHPIATCQLKLPLLLLLLLPPPLLPPLLLYCCFHCYCCGTSSTAASTATTTTTAITWCIEHGCTLTTCSSFTPKSGPAALRKHTALRLVCESSKVWSREFAIFGKKTWTGGLAVISTKCLFWFGRFGSCLLSPL